MTNYVQPVIRTLSADGQLHEFPPGTPPDVVDKAMADYAAERQPKSTGEDAALSAGSGLASGVSGVLDTLAHPGRVARALISPFAPQAGDTAGKFADFTAQNVMPNVAGAAKTTTDAASYQPQTTTGRVSKEIATYAPAALLPGGPLMRAARVLGPAAGQEAGHQVGEGSPYQPYAEGAGAVLGATGVAAAPTIGRTIARVANRASQFMGGPELLDPEREAAKRLAAAVMREGGPQKITQRLQEWSASGASDPSLLDVSGNNVRRLVRAAAGGPEGEAQNLAIDYGKRVAGNLQDNATNLARNLTPNEPRTAEQLAADLEQQQRTTANTQYRQPYQEPAAVTPEMVDALQGPEGRAAIGRAYVAARANRDTQQMGELKDLLGVAGEQSGGRDPLTGKLRSLADALSNVSAGSLDRVRIAMRETGGNLAAKGARDIARGYKARVSDIDTALDQTPGLQPARAAYRSFAQQRDAIPVGQSGVNAPAEQFVPQIAAMTPEARTAAGVGYRQAIVNTLERPTQGAVGPLNRLATSTQQTKNLSAAFGEPAAQRFQAGAGNEASRIDNARFISPNLGSQTALRADEASLIDTIPSHRLNFLAAALDMIKRGVTLTPTERAAIVKLGTTERNLRDLVSSLPQARPQQIARQVLLAGQLGNSRRQQ